MNYGLLESVKEFTAYVLGNNAMPWVQFKPDGNWEPDLPQYENQTTKLTKATNILIEDAKLKWSVMQDSGLVIGVKDGQPVPNPLLLKAWNQAQSVSQPIEEWKQNNPTP